MCIATQSRAASLMILTRVGRTSSIVASRLRRRPAFEEMPGTIEGKWAGRGMFSKLALDRWEAWVSRELGRRGRRAAIVCCVVPVQK